MELKEYIGMEFEALERNFTRATNGLTHQEYMWKPACGCNSIGLILFHMTRSEDTHVQARMQNKPLIWVAEKWYQKLNLDENDAGMHYTPEQVNAFQVPDSNDLLTYYNTVRAQTLAYLKNISPETFDKIVTVPRFGERSIGRLFSMVTGHGALHIGEMAYLRGIQRGLDK